MMTDAELQKLTIATASRLLARKEISPVELATTVFDRIERLNPQTNAFITIMKEEGMKAARAVEREIIGGNIRALSGVPLSVKDLYDTAATRTTAGAKIFAKRVPSEDAAGVTRLREAGAVIVGKTNLHEFAFGVTTVNPHFGTTRNPWDKDRIAGGSSGGSGTAVALNLGLGSIGSDTGGSIRIPSSLCGIAGLKPTYGRVSLRGVMPLSWSFDHAGPMANTVEDVAILLNVIAGYDARDPYSRNVDVPRYTDKLSGDVTGLRIGVPKSYFYERLAPEVANSISEALKRFAYLGAELTDIELPRLPAHRGVWLQIASPEAYSYHEKYLGQYGDQYGADVRARLEPGRELLSVDYVRAQRVRMMMKEECKEMFNAISVIVTPTVPIAAPCIDDLHKPWGSDTEHAVMALARFTRYFNIVGLPSLSIPCGFTGNGLPIGMQIVGKPFDEATVLRVAHAYEQTARWFEKRPNI